MPFTVKDLLQGRQRPVVVHPEEPARRALQLMIEHDFSQLPVIDGENRPLGMVTSDSILRALNNFGVTLDALQVSHAIVRTDHFQADEDLFDLLDDLRDEYAVLIVDGAERLTGIVTSYDTTEYFRRRAEDTMLLEDIESTLKEVIRAAFTDEDGELDTTALAHAVEEVTSQRQELRGRFFNALRSYLKEKEEGKVQVDQDLVEKIFSEHLDPKLPPRQFEELTLYEFTELLLKKSRWEEFYREIFALDDPSALRTLLDAVRETRNTLAHFRGEATPLQRDQLRFCAEWLARHQPSPVAGHYGNGETTQEGQEEGNEGVIVPVGEQIGAHESRYAPLAIWLLRQPPSRRRLHLSFDKIEEILGQQLPSSARRYRNWWANDPATHIQSQQWLDVGWAVARVDIGSQVVTFSRLRRHSKAYQGFFEGLLKELAAAASFPLKEAMPKGQSWQVVAGLPEWGAHVAVLAFSFTRNKQFRVELFLYSGDAEKDEAIWDALRDQQDEIEAELDERLSWEPLDGMRGARVALYHDGAIMMSEAELAELREWAVSAMVHFHSVIASRFNKAVEMAEQAAEEAAEEADSTEVVSA